MLVARVITVTYIKQNRDSSANMASGSILPHFFKWPKYGKAIREKTLFFCNKDLEVRQGKMKIMSRNAFYSLSTSTKGGGSMMSGAVKICNKRLSFVCLLQI